MHYVRRRHQFFTRFHFPIGAPQVTRCKSGRLAARRSVLKLYLQYEVNYRGRRLSPFLTRVHDKVYAMFFLLLDITSQNCLHQNVFCVNCSIFICVIIIYFLRIISMKFNFIFYYFKLHSKEKRTRLFNLVIHVGSL